MRTYRGRPLGRRELRRLDAKKRTGRFIAVDSVTTIGGFTASVFAARPPKRKAAA
jgi:hypothetical protein